MVYVQQMSVSSITSFLLHYSVDLGEKNRGEYNSIFGSSWETVNTVIHQSFSVSNIYDYLVNHNII